MMKSHLSPNFCHKILIRSLSNFKRWQIEDFSQDLSSLRLETDDQPIVDDANKVLVEVKAASINPIDVAIAQGYGHHLLRVARVAIDIKGAGKVTFDKFPMTLGRDFSGVIVNKGIAVRRFNIGDQVWGVIPPYINHGSHANLVVACQDHISLKPHNLNDVEAASIPYAGLTAYSAISCFGGLNEGNSYNKNVLVLGGSGGVGLLAIQILKSWGAIVTTTCASDALEWVQNESRADQVIDYNNSSELSQLSGSFDLVFNAASANKTIVDNTLQCLKKGCGSKYVTVTSPLLKNYDKNGYLFGTITTAKDAICDTVTGLKEGSQVRWAYFMPNGKALEHIKRLVEEGKIRATVQETFDFKDILKGYRRVMDGHLRGKIVVKMASDVNDNKTDN